MATAPRTDFLPRRFVVPRHGVPPTLAIRGMAKAIDRHCGGRRSATAQYQKTRTREENTLMVGTTPTQDERDAAAREFLDDPDAESSTYDACAYGLAGDWLILTDEEADERGKDSIRESAWAFNADFLVDYLPDGVGVEVIEALQPQCEGANDAILSMLGDRFDEFAGDAMSADGRGHFLSSWDGCEHEFQHGGREWFAYRT